LNRAWRSGYAQRIQPVIVDLRRGRREYPHFNPPNIMLNQMQLVSLAPLSLISIVSVGGEVALALGLFWILGAVISGLVTLETGWTLRQAMVKGEST
jgi:hypothetical protein